MIKEIKNIKVIDDYLIIDDCKYTLISYDENLYPELMDFKNYINDNYNNIHISNVSISNADCKLTCMNIQIGVPYTNGCRNISIDFLKDDYFYLYGPEYYLIDGVENLIPFLKEIVAKYYNKYVNG